MWREVMCAARCSLALLNVLTDELNMYVRTTNTAITANVELLLKPIVNLRIDSTKKASAMRILVSENVLAE